MISTEPRIGVHVTLKGDTIERITLSLSPQFTLACPSKKVADKLVPWMKAYASRKWSPFPLPLPETPFAKKATAYLQNTYLGTVLSYKELAQAIGHPGAARAIGTVCSGNLFPLLIPCHRVVHSSGGLGAYTPDPKIKEELLRFEGITDL